MPQKEKIFAKKFGTVILFYHICNSKLSAEPMKINIWKYSLLAKRK